MKAKRNTLSRLEVEATLADMTADTYAMVSRLVTFNTQFKESIQLDVYDRPSRFDQEDDAPTPPPKWLEPAKLFVLAVHQLIKQVVLIEQAYQKREAARAAEAPGTGPTHILASNTNIEKLVAATATRYTKGLVDLLGAGNVKTEDLVKLQERIKAETMIDWVDGKMGK